MKNFPTKANISGGDDTGAATSLGANEINSICVENETAVTASGQALTTGQAADTETSQLARAMTIAAQSGQMYTDSGAANAYVLDAVGTLVQPEEYFDGMTVSFKPDNDNTGNSVINVEAIGSKKILDTAGAEVAAGMLSSGTRYRLIYDSSLDTGTGAFEVDADLPSGTIMLFGQASAPVGWTKLTSWTDNAMLTINTQADGTALGSGGSVNPQSGHTHGAGTLKFQTAELTSTVLSMYNTSGTAITALASNLMDTPSTTDTRYALPYAANAGTFYTASGTGVTDSNTANIYQEIIACQKG